MNPSPDSPELDRAVKAIREEVVMSTFTVGIVAVDPTSPFTGGPHHNIPWRRAQPAAWE